MFVSPSISQCIPPLARPPRGMRNHPENVRRGKQAAARSKHKLMLTRRYRKNAGNPSRPHVKPAPLGGEMIPRVRRSRKRRERHPVTGKLYRHDTDTDIHGFETDTNWHGDVMVVLDKGHARMYEYFSHHDASFKKIHFYAFLYEEALLPILANRYNCSPDKLFLSGRPTSPKKAFTEAHKIPAGLYQAGLVDLEGSAPV